MVNICSVSSYVDLPLSAAYCASKAALLSLTNCLRMEVQALGVNVLGGWACSHGCDTAMMRTMMAGQTQSVLLTASCSGRSLNPSRDL